MNILKNRYNIFALLLFTPVVSAVSELDRIIPPEIKNDALYAAIYRLAAKEDIKTILEIGSSSGQGSTEAFVKGIVQNPCRPLLFCMEISQKRFSLLQEQYASVSQVCCYNVSSVPLESFPTADEVLRFMTTTRTNLDMYGSNAVLGWLKQDKEYVKSSGVIQHGIEHIKKKHAIDYFDMVLIDGSEFTGKAEFALIYGAHFILLDDINAFKNYANYQALLRDPAYQLLEQDKSLRNGYAIFKKKVWKQ